MIRQFKTKREGVDPSLFVGAQFDLRQSSMNQVRVDFAWLRRVLFANLATSLVTLIVIIAR